MKYLKLFEDFNQDSIDKVVQDITKKAEDNGVQIILEPTPTIPYAVGDFPCAGYFVSYGRPTLAVATGKPLKDWIMVLVHESSHMDQWLEGSKAWTNNFVDGKESVDYIDEWLSGKEMTEEEIDDLISRSIDVERDCEMRTIEKVKEYNLPVNVDEEIQKANSYILFYRMLKITRKWNKPGKAPYQIKEVWSQMPKTFYMDYSEVPEDLQELYLKYCFD